MPLYRAEGASSVTPVFEIEPAARSLILEIGFFDVYQAESLHRFIALNLQIDPIQYPNHDVDVVVPAVEKRRIHQSICCRKGFMSSHPDIMSCPTQSLTGKRVLVVGLGRFGGGVGVTRWLVQQGAGVTVTDLSAADSLRDSIRELSDLDVTLHLGEHDLDDLNETDLVIVNPAVIKKRSGIFRALRKRNIPWTTEMNLFCERCPAPVIGVTGSYGKSTTCAMLNEVLETSLQHGGTTYSGVHFGGNIGRSLLTNLPDIQPTDLVVLEMSNAQLEDLPRIDWAPGIAVITNIQPHHLERYDGFDSYIRAKLNIVGTAEHTQRVIVGECHRHARTMLDRCVSERSITVINVVHVDPTIDLRVPGRHNLANAECVFAIARHLGLDETVVRTSLQTFRGLPHRLEFVAQIDGVDYINDSKSTSPTATQTAVHSLQKPAVVIVGGRQKEEDPLNACAKTLASTARAVICMGESGTSWYQAVHEAATTRLPVQHSKALHRAEDLEKALVLARQEAREGDVVLFSPGAPSFDAYSNFAQRGEHFVRLVRS